MLGALIVTGYGGSQLLRHGHTTLPAYREHLNYRHVILAEQGKPVSFPAKGKINRKADRWRCGYRNCEKANAAL